MGERHRRPSQASDDVRSADDADAGAHSGELCVTGHAVVLGSARIHRGGTGGRMIARVGLAGVVLAAILSFGVLPAAAAQRSGPDQVLLQADEVVYDVDRKAVHAQGHVEVDYGDRVVLADTLSYDQANDRVTA